MDVYQATLWLQKASAKQDARAKQLLELIKRDEKDVIEIDDGTDKGRRRRRRRKRRRRRLPNMEL